MQQINHHEADYEGLIARSLKESDDWDMND